MSTNTLYNKNGLVITKNESIYESYFQLQNNRVYLDKLLNLQFIHAMMKVNGEFIEDSKIQLNDEGTTAQIFILVKHLYADLGIPQFYMYFNISSVKNDDDSTISYMIESIHDKPLDCDEDCELLDIKHANIECHFSNKHTCTIHQKISMNEIPKFIEKIMVLLYSRMFLNVKRFIDNFSII